MKYIYNGPSSGATLQDGAKQREVMLHTGAEVDLPEGNEYVKTLLALGHLTPVTAPAPAPVEASTPAATPTSAATPAPAEAPAKQPKTAMKGEPA